MLKIGLTGSIGSGKTTISKIFKDLGIPIYYSDIEAKRIQSEPEVKNKIISEFGTEILADDGSIDRKKLGAIAFSNPDKIEFLNKLVHPLVNADFNHWCDKQTAPYIIQESAIIFEKNIKFDKIITVSATKDIRIKRVMRRDGISKKEVENRMANQMTDEEKVKLADFVITNDGEDILNNIDNLKKQVLSIHNAILYGK